MTKKTEPISAHTVGVKRVATNSLFPNPHNPRMLFDRQPLEVLQESIKRVGILVPLTVYWEAKKNRFVILDGQRRWICAQNIHLKEVPVNQVEEPTLVQNIVTMFQIHKLREDWELMPTALKVELLMEQIKDKNDKRLAELTGLDESVITRCKKLISYDKEFQDMMLDSDPGKRIKADFFIELYSVIHDREVVKFEWFKEKTFIKQMLAKYLDETKTIKSVTDFRLIKQHIANAKRVGEMREFSKRLHRFSKVIDCSIKTLEIEEASIHAEAKSISKKVVLLIDSIKALNVDQFYGEEALWESISQLILVLEKKLREANKRR
jgi:ParB family chromosome partitioning protein